MLVQCCYCFSILKATQHNVLYKKNKMHIIKHKSSLLVLLINDTLLCNKSFDILYW